METPQSRVVSEEHQENGAPSLYISRAVSFIFHTVRFISRVVISIARAVRSIARAVSQKIWRQWASKQTLFTHNKKVNGE